MKENQTNNTIQAFWVAMGSLSSIGLAIISAAILSRYFNKADYGTYKQIVYVYSTLLVVFSAGLPRVFAYFLPRYSLEEGKNIVKKVNKVLFFAGFFFAVFLFVFSGVIANILNNPGLSYGLKIFSPIPMFLLPTLGIEGIFSTYKKTIYIAIYNTLSRLLMLVFIVVPVIVFKGDYISAVYGWLAVSVLTFAMAYYFKEIPFKNVKSIETSLKYKEIFGYSLPLVTASLWGIAIKSADQFYISKFFGKEVFAEYSNGFIELPFVSMVTASASVVLMPLFSKILSDNSGMDNLLTVWRSTLNKSSKIIFPLVVFFIAFATEIVVLMYSEQYSDSAIYFRINMVLNFFNIIIFAPLFFALGNTKLYSRVHMFLAIAVWVLGYLMIKIFNSPIAIAVNSTFLSIVKIMVFVYLSLKILHLKFSEFIPMRQILMILLQATMTIVLIKLIQIYFLNNLLIIIQLAICAVLYMLILLITAKFFRIDYYSIIRPLMKKILK